MCLRRFYEHLKKITSSGFINYVMFKLFLYYIIFFDIFLPVLMSFSSLFINRRVHCLLLITASDPHLDSAVVFADFPFVPGSDSCDRCACFLCRCCCWGNNDRTCSNRHGNSWRPPFSSVCAV